VDKHLLLKKFSSELQIGQPRDVICGDSGPFALISIEMVVQFNNILHLSELQLVCNILLITN